MLKQQTPDIYFAPLEGVTDSVFRRVHNACFSGVSKYFIPFISPAKELSYGSRQDYEISYAANYGVEAVPQVLTNSAELFLPTAAMLEDRGFREVNLNIGCPSGTVTAKCKGSGLLREPDRLRTLLDGIFGKVRIPVSVKTRIGFASPEEWEKLCALYAEYPIHELIVHPRTRTQFYSGTPYRAMFSEKYVYNGDIFSAEDYRELLRCYPKTKAVMLGRGAVTNPALPRECLGGAPLKREELIRFHDRLLKTYCEEWPAKAVPGHMHEIAGYFVWCFEDSKRVVKRMYKSRSLEEYEDAMAELFENCAMRETPAFVPPAERTVF